MGLLESPGELADITEIGLIPSHASRPAKGDVQNDALSLHYIWRVLNIEKDSVCRRWTGCHGPDYFEPNCVEPNYVEPDYVENYRKYSARRCAPRA